MKQIILVITLLLNYLIYGQSEVTKFIKNINYTKIILDESEKATFRSGTSEFVDFYPATIKNLKTDDSIVGLKITTLYDITGDSFSAALTGQKNIKHLENAFMDLKEISELVIFFESYIIPNIDIDLKKKNSTIYIFDSEELIIRYVISRATGKTKELFEVQIKNSEYPDKYFWTKSQVKKIPEVVETLKYIINSSK